jgi:hypothetical protein
MTPPSRPRRASEWLAAGFIAPRAGEERPPEGPLTRLTRAFVAPVEAEEPVVVPEEAGATGLASVAVLCRPEDAWAVGGAVALGLVGRHGTGGSRTAVVAAWGEGLVLAAARAPATPAARKLCALLRARGHEAAATGRLVHVVLSGDAPAEAVRIAAAAACPCATVLAGPRDEQIDALLRTQDHVLVDAEETIADLALTSLAAADVPARCVTVSAAPTAARALAAAGVALVPPLRAMAEEGLR